MKSLYPTRKSRILQLIRNTFKIAMLIVLALQANTASSQGLVFGSYMLQSGTPGADGAVYRFTNVTRGVDALLTIKGRSSSSIVINNLDVNDNGWDKAFQPQIGVKGGKVSGNTEWWMEFQINFVKTGTLEAVTVSGF